MANFTVLEFAFGEVEWREGLIRPAEAIVDGYIEVPDGPGWGVELDEEAMAEFAPEA